MSHVYFEYIFIWIIQHEKNTLFHNYVVHVKRQSSIGWASWVQDCLRFFPAQDHFKCIFWLKSLNSTNFQKSDLILSEIGCTVINVYIPRKKMSLHFTWILNLYNSTKYEVACWVFFSFKFQHWSECGWKHLNLSNCFFTI